MQLQGTTHIPWAPAATDTSKLRSLVLNPDQYPGVRLVEQHHASKQHLIPGSIMGTYAYSHEVLPHDQGIRCTIYGNLQYTKPDYYHAAQQIAAKQAAVCRFSALPNAAVEHVRGAFRSSGYHETYYDPCWQYVISGRCIGHLQQQCLQKSEQLSGQYELGTLRHEDAALVDSLWTYRSPGSQLMIEHLIAGRHTSCVRSQAGQPVAWAVEVEPGCAGMLHTLDGYRRQGLGGWVMACLLCKLQRQHMQQQAAARQLYTEQFSSSTTRNGSGVGGSSAATGWPGGHVYCYVVQKNTASVQLMQDLGLTRTGTFVWMGFTRKESAVVT